MLQLKDIQTAKLNIKNYVHQTPLIHSSNLSRVIGSDVYFKCENTQKTGSFKARGAFNRLLSLSSEEVKNGVVCYSSGNHAKAVCYAAKQP